MLLNRYLLAILGEIMSDIVVVETSIGNFEIELDENKAPITVKNFLDYVKEGFYDGLIFHRVIDGFMIQGGGLDQNMNEKKNRPPIKNEATNGLKNKKYTIAMARTSIVDSATSQFFINVSDNSFLDNVNTTPQGYGYAVFGKVIKGTEVIDKIKSVPTTTKGFHENVPKEPIFIKKMNIKK
ncbi:MAG: peptidyl-prolyl cis-trans isomerase [Candidatus Methanofastidiosa archaeon]|jgi:peptidyl-prolyl cis-trans isomerase B (cyclophilin B)|nr:peptidyl-prolyl cis-trans isomerase [Candidatus Methanofastidiosa archaeon]